MIVTPDFLTSEPVTTHVNFDVRSSDDSGTDEAGVVSDIAIDVSPILREPDHCLDNFSILISNISSLFKGSELKISPWLKFCDLLAVEPFDVI